MAEGKHTYKHKYLAYLARFICLNLGILWFLGQLLLYWVYLNWATAVCYGCKMEKQRQTNK